MNGGLCPSPRLRPAGDAAGEAPHFEALGPRPWLAVEPRPPSGWLRLFCRLSLYDRPVRPVFSFRRGGAEIGWRLGAGPVLGRGETILRLPAEADALWISPVGAPGPFGFALEAVEPLSRLELVRLGLAGDPARLRSALAVRALGWTPEAELNLLFSTAHRPLEDWPALRARSKAPADLKSFERPRSRWAEGPTAHLFAPSADAAALARLRENLAAQLYPRWSLAAAPPPDAPGDDLVGALAPGDRLAPHALACFVEAFARAPHALAAYCDADHGSAPDFKPDFSPVLEAARPYVGRLLLVRAGFLRTRFGGAGKIDARAGSGFAAAALEGLSRARVLHLPRPLIETPAPRAAEPPRAPARPRASPRVAVVIPTRDRAALLRRAVDSLAAHEGEGFDLVLVDNGGTEPEARALLARYGARANVRVLDAPGPFNFSKLCNLGAAAAPERAETLLFLNNDVEILHEGFLAALAAPASEPHVGAVGALLLYPDGRIQHAGVVLGMGEAAGHFLAGQDGAGQDGAGQGGGAPKGAEADWLGRALVPHEVSAVTGACLALGRASFARVGGFDEVNLPVEFNDLDLCLRLGELGLATLVAPGARALHLESGSRGRATFRRLSAHARERDYFRERWRDRLRDDPYFHPGLSLYSAAPRLA
ncbi:glycosyltransferase [Methylocella sp.]|uniref:glycosyltransferase family 2 protein n=1 Tax=Methylocella sp. TaxID=1978226 RepID=UPI0037846A2E